MITTDRIRVALEGWRETVAAQDDEVFLVDVIGAGDQLADLLEAIADDLAIGFVR